MSAPTWSSAAAARRARRVPVDDAEAAREAEHQRNVLGDCHPVDQAEIPVDERNGQVAQRALALAASRPR